MSGVRLDTVRRPREHAANITQARVKVPVPSVAVKISTGRPPHHRSWGWLPEYSVIGAIGLLLISLAYTAARSEEAWAGTLLWSGLILLFGPAAGRLAFGRPGERENLGLVLIPGFFLYLVKIMHSPVNFTSFDEFLHWRTLSDLVRSDHLFNVNPLLPSSALYPGLEMVTGALVKLSGLPYFTAGIIILGAGRIVLLLSFYLIFKELSRSGRLAGIATLVYMTNPNFVFFDADFSYESLALPLAGLLLFVIVRRQQLDRFEAGAKGLTVAAVITGSAVVMTHHITSYVVLGLLVLWTFLDKLKNTKQSSKPARPGPGPGGMAIFMLVAVLAWILNIAGIIIGYLSPHLQAAAKEMGNLIAQEGDSGRQLFQNSTTGVSSPLWERFVAFGAVGLILLVLPFGFWRIWKKYLNNPLVLTLAAAALLYPVSLAFRLTRAGWEAANRSSEFLFLGVGLVFALGVFQIATFPFPKGLKQAGPFLFSACLSVMLLGGIIAGWNPRQLLPGAYKVEEGSLSIEPQGIQAALWANTYLGPNNFMGVYGTNMNLMGSYGDQNVSTTLSGGINMAWVLFAPRLEAEQIEQIQRGLLKYIVVDRRLAQVPYLAASFYPNGSITEALDKFNNITGVKRIFDSGDIIIYDVGAISGAG